MGQALHLILSLEELSAIVYNIHITHELLEGSITKTLTQSATLLTELCLLRLPYGRLDLTERLYYHHLGT